jgi:hypothetical protein
MVKVTTRAMNQGQTELHRRRSEGVSQPLEAPSDGTPAVDENSGQ